MIDMHLLHALKQQPGFLGEQRFPQEVTNFINYIIFHGGGVTAKVVNMNCLFVIHQCAY